MRGFAHDHPGLYLAGLPPTIPGDPELAAVAAEFNSIFFDTVRHYGFPEPEATHAVRGLYSLVHGFIMLERAHRFAAPSSTDESFRWLVELFIAALDAQTVAPGAQGETS